MSFSGPKRGSGSDGPVSFFSDCQGLGGIYGRRQQWALTQGATHAGERGELILGFDSLGNDLNIEPIAETDD